MFFVCQIQFRTLWDTWVFEISKYFKIQEFLRSHSMMRSQGIIIIVKSVKSVKIVKSVQFQYYWKLQKCQNFQKWTDCQDCQNCQECLNCQKNPENHDYHNVKFPLCMWMGIKRANAMVCVLLLLGCCHIISCINISLMDWQLSLVGWDRMG